MDKFLKYFENKQFVRWVLKPNEELDIFWKNYINKNIDEKEQIELARLLILQLQSKKELDSGIESTDLFSKIVFELNKRNKKSTFRRIAITASKYAAVGIIFFSMGVAFYYYQKSEQFNKYIQQLEVFDQNNAQLILGDSKNVLITGKKSEIEYQSNGSVIINNQDTVKTASGLRKQELNQLIVPFGRNSSIKLSDGTVAFINAGSRLVYPSFFEGKKREVYLIGEGFFKVAHNAEIPFIVKTNDLEVKVLGTEFNLLAYPTDGTTEVVLVEGKVIVLETGFLFSKKEYILKPDQRATYNRENVETTISNVIVEDYVSWHEGYLNFEASDLNRIVKKLERYYNIQIKLENPMLGIRSITGKLKLDDDVESVLKVLANTASAELVKINKSYYVIK